MNEAAVRTPRADDPFGVLRRVLQPRDQPAPGERCDLCSEPIGGEHGHVADIAGRRLMCTCRGCYLLFTSQGSGGMRLRAVPAEYHLVEDFAFTQQQWDELAIPVDLVFLFRQSAADDDGAARLVALYPSPAGATESELDAAAWERVVGDDPVVGGLADDVQAALLRRSSSGHFSCLIVPIDACYELVGLVRTHWVGFSGGSEVWARIDAFFAELQRRAR